MNEMIAKNCKMPRKDKILRSYLSMCIPNTTASKDVKYSVNFEYLMSGEGITGMLETHC